jgi:hypothetical protein
MVAIKLQPTAGPSHNIISGNSNLGSSDEKDIRNQRGNGDSIKLVMKDREIQGKLRDTGVLFNDDV